MTQESVDVASAALARFAVASGEERSDAPGRQHPSSRAQLLTYLQASGDVHSIEALTRELGLHSNTVRAHLDVLLAAGQVERIRLRPQGRGRPPLAFRATRDTHSPYDELSRNLSHALTAAAQPSLAEETATRWAATLTPVPPAESADDAVDLAIVALRAMGFTADVTQLGDSIVLGSCPFAALISEHPVICDIHTALLTHVFDAAGQGVAVEGMDVWVKPGLCRARLTRPDLNPARTISPAVPALTEPSPERDTP